MGPPDPPSIPPPPVDPAFSAQQAKAQADLTKNLQTQTQGDMANLMARYGTLLAMSGVSGSSPLATPLATTPGPMMPGGGRF